MKRLNILIVPCTDWLKGPQQRLHHLAREWSKRNNVYVFNLERNDTISYELGADRLRYSTLVKSPMIKSRNLAVLMISNFLLHLLSLIQIIKSKQIDVVVAEGLGASNAALIATKIMKRCFVFEYSDDYPSFVCIYVSNRLFKIILYKLAKLLVKFNVMFSDSTIVVSDKLFHEAKINGGKQVYTILNGVSEEFFLTEPKQKTFGNSSTIITYIGAIEPWVSFKNVIDAVSNLSRKNNMRIVFQIVGDGTCLESLKVYVNKKGLGEIVKFTGWVPYIKVREYIMMSDICVLPFDLSKISVCSMPMKINEYAISKKPIITTPIPQIKRVYGCSVIYATTMEEYIRGIQLVLKDNKRILQITENAYKIAKRYSWENLAKVYERILLKLVRKNI